MSPVHNVVGRPVHGADFFDRDQERALLWRLLRRHHVLILAPRRVGKTSLMRSMLAECADQEVHAALCLTAADVKSESAFVAKLFVHAARQDAGVRAALWASRLGQALGRIEGAELPGVSVAMQALPADAWESTGEALATALANSPGRWVVMVDELPIFVLYLLRADPTAERARRFLEWFQALRQGPADAPDGVRWLLAGSVGLDAVTRRHGLTSTISDLRVETLGPFSPRVADDFLVALARTEGLALPQETRQHLLTRLGHLVPYYVQLLFSRLVDAGPTGGPVAREDVDRAWEELLHPRHHLYFDPWVQRLDLELGLASAAHARTVLLACARDPSGASGAALAQLLGRSLRDPDARDRELSWLLPVLCSDGYLDRADNRYPFRSPLLRDFWLRRFQP